jgi:hypothetical protein
MTKMMPTKFDRLRFTGIQFKIYLSEECDLDIITKAGENLSAALQTAFFCISLHFPQLLA